MENALIVTNTKNSIVFFTEMLECISCKQVTVAMNVEEAKRLLSEREFDLCIINDSLSDEEGEALALKTASYKMTQTVLIVKAELYESVTIRVERAGIITVPKPINKEIFEYVLRISKAVYNKMLFIQKENSKLIKKTEDIRIIDRAKCILISHFSMTESEAHKYIEKQAMGFRTNRRKIAEKILKTYDR